MKHYKVYKYTFPDGMVYIGVTSKTLEERRDNGYHHNKRLQAAMRLCGWRNIKKEILFSGLSQDDAFSLEKEVIASCDATNPKCGYNVSSGGKATFSGLKHTTKYREKMSALFKGRSWSQETLIRMKESHAKERKPVVCISTEGNTSIRYESLGEAAKTVGGHKGNISRACLSGKLYKGFLWRFELGEEVMNG